VVVDLTGKGGHVRTIPVPEWVKARIDEWILASGTASGRLFRSINKNGVVWGEGLTEKVVWYVVKNFAKTIGIEKVAPHDLRRTCARLCHVSGGELEQIQFFLGHVSVQTTGALDEALETFSKLAPRQVKLVELRYFGGWGEQETAEVLKISPRTVRRDWDFAKSWLMRELSR
jgi:integrase